MKYSFFLLLFFLQGTFENVFSQNETPSMDAKIPPIPSGDYTAAFFKMIFMLVGILILVLLVGWLIKKYAYGKFKGSRDNQNIYILERKALSPKSSLYLIEVDGARLLVVESQLEVRCLHECPIEDPSTHS